MICIEKNQYKLIQKKSCPKNVVGQLFYFQNYLNQRFKITVSIT